MISGNWPDLRGHQMTQDPKIGYHRLPLVASNTLVFTAKLNKGRISRGLHQPPPPNLFCIVCVDNIALMTHVFPCSRRALKPQLTNKRHAFLLPKDVNYPSHVTMAWIVTTQSRRSGRTVNSSTEGLHERMRWEQLWGVFWLNVCHLFFFEVLSIIHQ